MKNRPLCCVCILILFIQSIVLILTGGWSQKDAPASVFLNKQDNNSIYFCGQVYKKSSTSKVQVLYLKHNSNVKSNVLVYDQNKVSVSHGDIVSVRGIVQAFERASNPGNFDQAFYYACQDIQCAILAEKVVIEEKHTNHFREFLYQVKMRWSAMLKQQMGKKNGGILATVLLGEKAGMDEEIKELYQKNGIGHILAISGLHISFIGLGLYKLMKRCGMGYVWSGVLSIGILTIYVCMIGGTVSVIRAYLMLILRIGADMAGRVYDLLTALALSATVTTLIQPLYLMDAGFLMSYGAVLGLVVVYPHLKKSCFLRGKIWEGFLASLSINLFLFPIMLWFYYEFSTYSLIWNLLVIPLMSVVLGCGMIGSFLMWVWPPLGSACLRICAWILEGYEWLVRLGCRLPLARVVFGKPEWWKMLLYYLILAIFLWFVSRTQKPKLWVWCLLFPMFVFMRVFHPAKLIVTMLDVGQGDAIFFRSPEGMSCLIDSGSSDIDQVGKYRIEPFLKSQGIHTLDYVFVTHGDADHCNGIQEMISRQNVGVSIKTLVLPVNFRRDQLLIELWRVAQKNKIEVAVLLPGQGIREGAFSVRCLQPGRKEELDGNAGSLVLDLRYGDFSMLCTGDVEGAGEMLLTERLKGQTYQVLKVAHHGSKHSTSSEFLETIEGKIALISAGTNNRYNHPHAETIRRLEQYDYAMYQTSKNGAITLQTDGNSLTISLHTFRL